jgi:hypothetical protein
MANVSPEAVRSTWARFLVWQLRLVTNTKPDVLRPLAKLPAHIDYEDVRYAADQGWIVLDGDQACLTEAGCKLEGPVGWDVKVAA